ncbi:MAG: hypothetical protein QXR62_05395 [Candidatus Bathyarchaeia archaeon]
MSSSNFTLTEEIDENGEPVLTVKVDVSFRIEAGIDRKVKIKGEKGKMVLSQ